MEYLGIEAQKPKVGVFDFTGCEGCELQLANKEDTLAAFLSAVEVVHFREISSVNRDTYAVAFIEGAITRPDEIERLKKIREKAAVLVALGSCACFGGVNRLKNDYDLDKANAEVYGDLPKETIPTRAVKDVVPVDLEIPGCPVSKAEVEQIVRHVVWGVPYQFPQYPVCLECKQRGVSCLMERGKLCLGSVTRGGCNAPCPAGGLGCWGCRGPAAAANYPGFFEAAKLQGFTQQDVRERLAFFGGFEGVR